MALLPPRVIGPLSECSGGVRVQSQLSGATVRVFADGTVVAQGTAASADQIFGLLAGQSLPAGSMVTATQAVGVETSDPSPEPVEVQAQPPSVGLVGYRSGLNECGECLWLEGLVPGAKVTVDVNGRTEASGESYDGTARLHLATPLGAGDGVTAQQEACGDTGPSTAGPPVSLVAEYARGKLPTPTVESPLRACQKGVVVDGVTHGARVTLLRSAGPNLNACFDASGLRFGVNPPLAEGETVGARQELPACKLESDDAAPVVVGPAEPVPAPTILAPLCAGGTTVTLTGLMFGSRVRIQSDGVDLGEAEAPTEGQFDFLVTPLAGGAVVTATQELCGIFSEPGNAVSVDPAPGSLPQPALPGPLFACAGVVRVEQLHPGVRVYVYSDALGAPIGEAQVFATAADVTVAPLLLEGDDVHAVQRGCGTVSAGSDRVRVQGIERLGPPRVAEPLYSCEGAVLVVEVMPGARVDVFVNGLFRGTEATGHTEVEVPISGSLAVGDTVTARQRLCEVVTEESEEVTVTEFIGRWRRVGGDAHAQILAVHAALLHTGQIVYFGGDQHTSSLNASGDVDHTRLYDCATGAVAGVTGLPASADLFCAGHALLEDGRLLVGGGTRNWGGGGVHPSAHFIGSRESWVFTPGSGWAPTGKLVTQRAEEVAGDKDTERTGGRWYPTLVTLPDGRVLAISGHPEVDDSRHNNHSLELFDPATDTWSIVGSADYDNIGAEAGRAYEYPRMHVLPDGTVLSASTMADGNLERWQPYSDATDWDHVVGGPPDSRYHSPISLYATSVLLPLSFTDEHRARVLLCGGSTPYLLNLDAPAWQATPRNLADHPAAGDFNPERLNLDAVLLPTGEVFVQGGVKNVNDDGTAVRKAESYDPEDGALGTWRALPAAERPRNYHSVALLMPDGAVWVAGSNFNAGTGLANRELRIEIFEPWYFCGPRPTITDAPPRACAGEEFEIRTPDADRIERVVLVRAGSVTHNFSSDQRHVRLRFDHPKSGTLVATLPSGNVVVPGYYLLFVLGADRRPSHGRFIQVCRSRRIGPVFPFDPDRLRWLLELLRRLAPEEVDLDDLLGALAGGRRRPPGPPHRVRLPPTVVDPHRRAHHGGHDHDHGGHDHDHDEARPEPHHDDD